MFVTQGVKEFSQFASFQSLIGLCDVCDKLEYKKGLFSPFCFNP